MKAKAVIIILVLICLGLGVALYLNFSKSQEEIKTVEKKREEVSNNWVRASIDLTEQKKNAILLQTNLALRTEEVKALSNDLSVVKTKLDKTEAEAKAAAQAAQEELAKRDAKITELETQRDDLTKRMTELNVSITSLEKQITDTEKKLTASEGDRTFLLKELKRLQAEKAELERQFNNLAFLREQVRKLRDELSIAKRLEWIRRGLVGENLSGGELMQRGFGKRVPQTNYNLNVELRQDGTVKVGGTNAPASPSTNAPADK